MAKCWSFGVSQDYVALDLVKRQSAMQDLIFDKRLPVTVRFSKIGRYTDSVDCLYVSPLVGMCH